MNEADTRAELIDPLLTAAGWGVVDGSRIRREFSITIVPPGGIKGRRVVKHRPLGQVNAIGGRAIAGLAHMHLGPQHTPLCFLCAARVRATWPPRTRTNTGLEPR